MNPVFRYAAGHGPVLIIMPHAGTEIPAEIATRMTPAALRQMDRAWHIDALYDFPTARQVPRLLSVYSRYVIDLNRSPEGLNRFAETDESGLCPLHCFDRSPIYRPGAAPDQREVRERHRAYWAPFHARVATELARLKRAYRIAVLFYAETVASRVPIYYDGDLAPDFDLKSGGGSRAAPALIRRLSDTLDSFPAYRHVVDGRYKGGFIVQHYGSPEENIHCFLLELSQATYMDEDAKRLDPERAREVGTALDVILRATIGWAEDESKKLGGRTTATADQ